jgi:hypothetical protein
MSFILTITLSPNDKISEEALAQWVLPNAKVKFRLEKSISSKRAQILSLETTKGGSSQHFLTDNADPDARYWDMPRELLPEIASLLKILRQNTKSIFVFQCRFNSEVQLCRLLRGKLA